MHKQRQQQPRQKQLTRKARQVGTQLATRKKSSGRHAAIKTPFPRAMRRGMSHKNLALPPIAHAARSGLQRRDTIPAVGRTFAIGDIHGELAHLNRLLAKLPPLFSEDTLVFLGDYLDRGPQSIEVVERIESLRQSERCAVITLRGNHEDAWLETLDAPNPGFLLPEGNGCRALLRSVVDVSAMDDLKQTMLLLQPQEWFPAGLRSWMEALPFFYEDEHAIYVHAGLDGEGHEWMHPRMGRQRPLLWMRERDFFQGYSGKRVVFGHTDTSSLPPDGVASTPDHVREVWRRGDLIGIDTGCGRSGFLSCIELPADRVYDSR